MEIGLAQYWKMQLEAGAIDAATYRAQIATLGEEPDLLIVDEEPETAVPDTPFRYEHDLQVALMDWAEAMEHEYPVLRWLYAIPNGGHRITAVAVRMKKEGVRAGVSDLFLPYPVNGFHGMYLETKLPKNHLTDTQVEFFNAMSAQGYLCVEWIDLQKTITLIEMYLNGEIDQSWPNPFLRSDFNRID